MDIKITLTKNPKPKPEPKSLGFGKYFTDHMFVMAYTKSIGWHSAAILPYSPLPLDPAAMVLHYGQAVFEGLKCYKTDDGRVLLFRPERNFQRFNLSNDRLCIPHLPEEDALEALTELIKVDKSWIPTGEGVSLYIRPFVISTEPGLGVRPSSTYQFVIILSPVGSYYPGGMKPVKIHIETEYARAVKGGMGFTKAAGNYAVSMKGQIEALEHGYDQVLWLDGAQRKYIEEVGAMNVFFKIDDKIVTPALEGSILAGVTRDSVIELLKHWGIPVEERRIAVDELADAYSKGLLKEAFGTGTAAVISPIGTLNWNGKKMDLGNIGETTQKLYDELTGIQYGRRPDPFGWVKEVKEK